MEGNLHFRRSACAVLVLAAVAGCAEIERRTGLGPETQAGVAGGAAAGGVIAGVAGASPAWIAASTILGAVAGGVIGDQLSNRDKDELAQTSYDAFQTAQPGETRNWRNPNTGAYGTVRINEAFTRSDGAPCKRFTETIAADREIHTIDGVACRNGRGEWTVVEI